MVVIGIIGVVILGGLAIGLIRTIDAKPEEMEDNPQERLCVSRVLTDSETGGAGAVLLFGDPQEVVNTMRYDESGGAYKVKKVGLPYMAAIVNTGRLVNFRTGETCTISEIEKPELVRRVLGAAHGWPRTSPDNEPLPMLEGPAFETDFLPVLTEFKMEVDDE